LVFAGRLKWERESGRWRRKRGLAPERISPRPL